MIIGLIIMAAGIRGRRIGNLPGDATDLVINLATGNTEGAGEVLRRKDDASNLDASFDAAASSISDRVGAAVSGGASAAAATGAAGAVGAKVVNASMASSEKVEALVAMGKRLRAEGFTVSENRALGDNPRPGVHLATGYHYKFGNSGAVDVNWPNKAQEPAKMDELAPRLRKAGFHVLWRVKGHYNHLHYDISRSDI